MSGTALCTGDIAMNILKVEKAEDNKEANKL